MKIFDWNKPILCLETKELLRDDVAYLFEVLHVILDINHFGLVPPNFVSTSACKCFTKNYNKGYI